MEFVKHVCQSGWEWLNFKYGLKGLVKLCVVVDGLGQTFCGSGWVQMNFLSAWERLVKLHVGVEWIG